MCRRDRRQNIRFRRKNRKKEWKRKKNQNANETLEIINKIIDYNNNAQNFFHHASKVDKTKSEPKIEESIAERAQLKNMIAEIKKKKKT